MLGITTKLRETSLIKILIQITLLTTFPGAFFFYRAFRDTSKQKSQSSKMHPTKSSTKLKLNSKFKKEIWKNNKSWNIIDCATCITYTSFLLKLKLPHFALSKRKGGSLHILIEIPSDWPSSQPKVILIT